MTIEAFLTNYSPQVQEISLYLRRIVLEVVPNTEEILFEGWKNISYGTGQSRGSKDLILYIAPLKDSVNLGFYRGANLADEKKLLKGTGKLLRHVKLKLVTDFESDAIKDLINEAKRERFGNE